MFILGIDPGTAITGYGLLEIKKSPQAIKYGCIRTSASDEMPDRLRIIYEGVIDIIKKYHPQEVAIEEIFFNKNSKTALSIGQARGVIILAAFYEGAKIFSYTPLEIKQAITDNGRAEKSQVQFMIKKLLCLPQIPYPDDTADALAAALCHYYSRKLKKYEKNLSPN
ncbi:MAG: crossover junction endodeoxyribonuclease RuvC [Candidatus Aerophobetes bacterium]|nr:crossover junction endodeoxyribonuclease RuvC [Candidatus Aerophobetes bacterium]